MARRFETRWTSESRSARSYSMKHPVLDGLGISGWLLALGCLACSSGGSSSPPSDAIPPEVTENRDDWPLPGRDYRNSRATTDSTIDSTTVASLGVVWEVPLPGRGGYGNASTTPLIVGDTVYVPDLTSNIQAIARDTGTLRWQRNLDSFVIGPNGVAVGWGRLYAVDGTDDVVALDLATGAELWRRTITRIETDGIDIQPTVFGKLVLASTVPVSLQGIYAGGDRGILQALDVETGELRWEF